MKISPLIFCLLLWGSFLFQSCNSGERKAILVISDTNLFDPVTGQMLPNRTIMAEDDWIVAIGTPDNLLEVPEDAYVIDGSGKFVIPGLIDAHVHLDFLLDAVNVKGEEVLPLYLGNGVTTVRCIGDQIEPQKRIAAYGHAYPERSPTIFISSPLIDGSKPYHASGHALNDPAKVPAFLDSMVAYGVETLKMYVKLDSAVFRKVIQEGHERGLIVAAHLPSRHVSLRDAISWGLDVVEHIWGIEDDSVLMAQMAEKGTMVDPTLVVFKNMLYLPDLPEVWQSSDHYYVPDTLHASWDAFRQNPKFNEENFKSRHETMMSYKRITGALYRAGVTLLAGSDSPEPYCPPGFALHDELVLLVESGLPPEAALKCATINNALALRQANNIGTVEIGKIADMVILDANPLDDIRNTRMIHRVIHGGIVGDPKSILPEPRPGRNVSAGN